MTDKSQNTTVGVSCEMIIQSEGKILMGKRGKKFGQGTWAFPGGHLESGETVEDCARRELKEEIGIIPKKMKLLGIMNDINNVKGQARQYIRFIFLIEDYSGKIENKESELCDGWEWFSLNKLPKPIFVGHKKIFC